VNVTLTKGVSYNRIEAVLDREVAKLSTTIPTKAEIDRARRQFHSWAQYERDGVTFQGMLLSVGEGLATWEFGDRLMSKVGKIRPERVREVAKAYLVKDRRSVVRFHAQEAPT